MNFHKLGKSFVYATEGIILAVKTEQNFRLHLLSAGIVFVAGLLTGLSKWEWISVIILIFGMFMIELVNTAIEKIVDLASPDFHPLAKQAKDLAAGACLIFAICTVIVGLIIFIPKWSVILF